jgi:competence protein ComEC
MEEAKSIESLSLVFTAGVVAGTMVSTGAAGAVSALLLPLLTLPLLFRDRLRLSPDRWAIGLTLLTFLLLGVFCAAVRSIPWVEEPSALQLWADEAASALRARIDALPFRAQGTAPLLKAFLTADRSGLQEGVIQTFRASGASHLLALSGLHMGILYLLFDKLTLPWGGSRSAAIVRFVLFGLGGGFFTLMTGASPSIVRAYLFILIGEILRVSGRPRKASRVLCLALLVQLVLDPGVIRTAGFQLSYLAMAGIFLLYPVLQSWYPEGNRYNPLRYIWNAAALAISCQVFTAPLAWLRFHSFPRHFLLTNLMAIPLTTGLLASAVMALLLDALHLCPPVLIKIADSLSCLLLWMLEIISSM